MRRTGKKIRTISLLTLLVISSFSIAGAVEKDLSLIPPNAEPGKCYAKVMVPAKDRKSVV
jgi:hypothetical protein